MTTTDRRDLAERAIAWRTATLESVCDVIDEWAHGVIYRATRCPSYFDLNLVRVRDRAAMGVDELVAIADRALGDLGHRKLEFDSAEDASPLRPELESRGWRTTPLVWMLHGGEPVDSPSAAVEEVAYDEVADLRTAWHHEDFPGNDPTAYHEMAREVALAHGARVFAGFRDETPMGFAQLTCLGDRMEIEQVYVHPSHRGQGLGTAITSAAIHAGADADELWICADDEGRAKHLYARLGFRPANTTVEFLRLPRPDRPPTATPPAECR